MTFIFKRTLGFSVEWVNKTLAKVVEGVDRYALFLDNLTAQQTTEFKEAVSSQNGVCWFGLPNATDLWQVVDAGIAQLLKTLTKKEQDDWLMDDENSDKWYGHTEDKKSFTASERRILISHWCGEAWKKLISGTYDSFIKGCWERTGCLITADGSEDEKIKPESLSDYKVPPPIDYVEATTAVAVANVVPEVIIDPSIEQEPEPEVELEEEEEPIDEEEVQLDREEDRTFADEMVGMKVKVLYEHGWCEGEIIYFNKALQEYKVSFVDGDYDFIPEDDIGTADVQVIM